ncbi:MAG: YdcF family protein [Gammaproteobacteria bacterium]|nr:YdcF family protein [Gammaproteobacteria bacterium]
MSLRWLIWSLLSPSQILLGIAIVGGLLLAVGRQGGRARDVGRVLCILGGTGLFVFGFLPTSHFIAHALETRFPQPKLPDHITGIVLLSGAERPAATEAYGEPQFSSAAGRYTTTLRLAARYPDARIVFTGGPAVDPDTGKEGQTAVAHRMLSSIGIDPARLTFEERSTDTCDNASNTKALVQPRAGETWVVVTSAMHMPRTVACFRAIEWEVIPQPADYHSDVSGVTTRTFQIADNLALLDTALHEWVGLVYYRLSGRTRELWPAPSTDGAFDPSRASP